jgi:hypothetical protein
MAQGAIKLLIEKGFGWGLVPMLINKEVEFKETNARGAHGNRVPTWEPWAKIMAAKEKVILAGARPVPKLLESLRNLERQYGPTLAAAVALHDGGVNFLKQAARRNFHRVSPKHLAMLKEAQEHLGLCASCEDKIVGVGADRSVDLYKEAQAQWFGQELAVSL